VLNVQGVQNVGQKDVHTAEPLVTERSLVEVEIAIGKLKRYKSLGTDQIPVELIKAGGEMLCSEIHKTYLFYMAEVGIATAAEGIYYCTNS
jgi:hypothetical protein